MAYKEFYKGEIAEQRGNKAGYLLSSLLVISFVPISSPFLLTAIGGSTLLTSAYILIIRGQEKIRKRDAIIIYNENLESKKEKITQ